MSIRFEMSYARWVGQARLMIARLRVNQGEFLRQQFRLLVKRLFDFTPPKSQAQGRKRVAKDIAKVLTPFDAARIRNKRLREIVRRGDIPAFNAVAESAGKSWRASPPSDFAGRHARFRDNRGRVRRRATPNFVLGRPATSALNRYIRRKQGHVGIARAGWYPGLAAVGGSAVNWVSRHGDRFGAVEDRTNSPGAPEILARNRSPWANRRDEGRRILTNALEARRRDMEKNLRILLSKTTTGLAA